jgi:hypothetical protein
MRDHLRVLPSVNYSKSLDSSLFDDHLHWAVTIAVR